MTEPDRINIKTVLILFEDVAFSLGDTCITLDKLKICRAFFPSSIIQINFQPDAPKSMYNGLLKHNPNIDHISYLETKEIDFNNYEIIICATTNEPSISAILHEKSYNRDTNAHFSIFSMTNKVINPDIETSFPKHEDLIAYIKNNPSLTNRPKELYISDEEINWADRWFEERGVLSNEQIFILIDSASTHHKIIKPPVIKALCSFLLSNSNIKILLFDERNEQKEHFYYQLLGDSLFHKLIFSKQQPFRNDLSLIASNYVKHIFGPCSGLSHCSSAIYNYFARTRSGIKYIPKITVYTGKYYIKEHDAFTWWGTSPLVTVLLLTKRKNKKTGLILGKKRTTHVNDLEMAQPVSEYTATILISLMREVTKIVVEE